MILAIASGKSAHPEQGRDAVDPERRGRDRYTKPEETSMPVTLVQGATILLTGDSITDCGRRAHQYGPLGRGYAFFLSSWVAAKFPERAISFINRGLSGDRVSDLAGRWSRDALSLRPWLVSILVGVNDTWRRFDSGETTTTAGFAAAAQRAKPGYWAEDGVHPTAAGHALIAQAWLKHVLDIG